MVTPLTPPAGVPRGHRVRRFPSSSSTEAPQTLPDHSATAAAAGQHLTPTQLLPPPPIRTGRRTLKKNCAQALRGFDPANDRADALLRPSPYGGGGAAPTHTSPQPPLDPLRGSFERDRTARTSVFTAMPPFVYDWAASGSSRGGRGGGAVPGPVEEDEEDESGWSALHAAISTGQLQLIPAIQRSIGIDVCDHQGRTAAHLACRLRKWVALNTLLHHGARPDVQDGASRSPLHDACEANSVQCVKSLLASGADWSVVDAEGRGALHVAVAHGHAACVAELLRAAPNAGSLVPLCGWSFLHEAAAHNRADILRLLTESTPTMLPQEPGPSGVTALHLAAYAGAVRCAKYLLSRGVVTAPVDTWGCTPLHWACCAGAHLMAAVLIRKSGVLTVADKAGRGPLHVAAIYGRQRCMQLLLQRGVDPAARSGGDGRMAHHHAAVYDHVRCLELLLGGPWRVAVNARDAGGCPALYLAARSRSVACCGVLLQHGAALHAVCTNGMTALGGAAMGESLAAVAMLIGGAATGGQPKDAEGRRTSQPMHLAARYGSLDVLRLFVSSGCDPLCLSTEGRTLLMSAAAGGQCAALQYLLSLGVPADAVVAGTGQHVTHFAAQHGHRDALATLRKAVPALSLSVEDSSGLTALHYAAMGGHLEVARWLLQHTTLLTAGTTALHCAARFGHEAVVRAFLDEEPGLVFSRDARGATPLHVAAFYGHVAAVRPLLGVRAADADDVVDAQKESALHKACAAGHPAVAEALLRHGCAARLRNAAGWEPLHLAAVSPAAAALLPLLLAAAPAGDARAALARARAPCDGGSTVLHLAARAGVAAEAVESVAAAFEEELAPLYDSRDAGGLTPLDWACLSPKTAPVAALLRRTTVQSRSLHHAALAGGAGVVRRLLERGFCHGAADAQGQTAAHMAARAGHVSVLSLFPPESLLVGDLEGMTPLLVAAEQGWLDVLQTFFNEAHFCEQDKTGRSFVHCAAQFGRTATLRFLVEELGMDVREAAAPRLLTPLHYAAAGGHEDTAQCILACVEEALPRKQWARGSGREVSGQAAAADRGRVARQKLVDAFDVDGATALHAAALQGHAGVCQLLLRGGARLSGENVQGWTPVDCCLQMGALVPEEDDGRSGCSSPVALAHRQRAVLDVFGAWCRVRPEFDRVVAVVEQAAMELRHAGVAGATPVGTPGMPPGKRRTFGGGETAAAATTDIDEEEASARQALEAEGLDELVDVCGRMARHARKITVRAARGLEKAVAGQAEAVKAYDTLAALSIPLARIISHVQVTTEQLMSRYFAKWRGFVGIRQDEEAESPSSARQDHQDELEACIELGRSREIVRLLPRPKVDAPLPHCGRTALQHAAALGRVECVRVLLEQAGADPRATPPGTDPALHLAIAVGSLPCFQALYGRDGGDGPLRSLYGDDALQHASKVPGREAIVEHLAAQTASLTETRAHGLRLWGEELGPLCELVASRPAEARARLRELVRGGGEPLLEQTSAGRTALQLAVTVEDHELIAELLTLAGEHGVFKPLVLAQDAAGHNVFHHASLVSIESGEVLETLLDALHEYCFEEAENLLVPLLDAQNAKGDTPCHLAVRSETGLFQAMLEIDADRVLSTPNARGLLPVHACCAHGCLTNLSHILAADPAQASAPDVGALGWTPLQHAVAAGGGAGGVVVDRLLAALDGDEAERGRALHIAGCLGFEQLVGALTVGGVPAETEALHTLHRAAANGHLACVKALLERGGDTTLLEGRDERVNTPLHAAAHHGREGVVVALLARAAAEEDYTLQTLLEAVNWLGNTALHGAALSESLAVVRALLAAGADARARGALGWTPGHCACTVADPSSLEAAGVRVTLHGGGDGDAAAVGEDAAGVVIYDSNAQPVEALLGGGGGGGSVESRLKGGVLTYRLPQPTRLLGCATEGEVEEFALLWGERWVVCEDARTRLPGRVAGCAEVTNSVLTELAHHGCELDAEMLGLAFDAGHLACLRQLLALGARPQMPATRGEACQTLLHTVCRAGSEDACEVLSASPWAPSLARVFNKEHHTPLHEACLGENARCVRLLLAVTDDADVCHPDGHTALTEAVVLGRLEVVKLLVAGGARPGLPNGQWYSALHCAVDQQQMKAALHLIHHEGMSLNTPVNSDGASVMHLACSLPQVESVLPKLLANGGMLHAPFTTGGYTPMHAACAAGLSAVVSLAVENEHVNVWNAGEREGTGVPVLAAVLHRQAALVQKLLAAPPFAECSELRGSFYACDAHGFDCLHTACHEGLLDEVQTLLENGIQPKRCGASERNLLHIAVSAGKRSLRVLDYLLRECTKGVGGSVNRASLEISVFSIWEVDAAGRSPLHAACAVDCPEAATMLLRFGFHVDSRSSVGTPLMACAAGAAEATLRLLLRRGADPSLVNGDGKTAADVAQEAGCGYLAEVLTQAASECRESRSTPGGRCLIKE